MSKTKYASALDRMLWGMVEIILNQGWPSPDEEYDGSKPFEIVVNEEFRIEHMGDHVTHVLCDDTLVYARNSYTEYTSVLRPGDWIMRFEEAIHQDLRLQFKLDLAEEIVTAKKDSACVALFEG